MKITIMGNAIVDSISSVKDSFLEKNNMVKGSMSLIDKEVMKNLQKQCVNPKRNSGGSGANTAMAIAYLGGDINFIGNVAKDDDGDFFIKSISEKNVKFLTHITSSEEATAKSFIFVTPDAERTMNTYLGISTDLHRENLDIEELKSSDLVYVEGYLYDTSVSQDTLIYACKIAKENGAKIAFTLSDLFCVDRHREDFMKFIKENVDILFANESEILSLFETSSLEEAISKVNNICEITAITVGAKGSLIVNKEKVIEVPCEPIEKLVDTTGAGDNYAGGFLYGYSEGKSLEECGKLGSKLASKIIQKIGASL